MTTREKLYQAVGPATDEQCLAALNILTGKMMTDTVPDSVHTAAEVCKLVRCSRTTLWRLRIMPVFWIGNRPRYKIEDVQAALKGRKI